MNNSNSVWKLLTELNSKKGISEIIINNVDNVYIERSGEMIRLNTDLKAADIVSFCKEVALLNKCSFGPNHPIIDGSLDDGSRINIISSSYTGGSPAITIRKYLKEISKFDDDANYFWLDAKWVQFFKTLVHARMNVLISGGTGDGKTTFLNLMLQEVSPSHRVITIEDTKELNFDLPNTVRLIAKKNISQIENPLTTRDLLKNTLRMRPDRIIIGEVRGEEAFDLLQAMNTGHDGSMCTVHANSPAESLSRLENLFLFSGYNVPLKAVRSQISTAVDFIVQLDKNREGKRIVSKVVEVSNMENDIILIQDIGKVMDEGRIEFTGLVPKRLPQLMEYGISANFFL